MSPRRTLVVLPIPLNSQHHNLDRNQIEEHTMVIGILKLHRRVPALTPTYIPRQGYPYGTTDRLVQGRRASNLVAGDSMEKPAVESSGEPTPSQDTLDDAQRAAKPAPEEAGESTGRRFIDSVYSLQRARKQQAKAELLLSSLKGSELAQPSTDAQLDSTPPLPALPAAPRYPCPYLTDEEISQYLMPLYCRAWFVGSSEWLRDYNQAPNRSSPELVKTFHFHEHEHAVKFVDQVEVIHSSENVSDMRAVDTHSEPTNLTLYHGLCILNSTTLPFLCPIVKHTSGSILTRHDRRKTPTLRSCLKSCRELPCEMSASQFC